MTSMSEAPAAGRTCGLRERKKARTRAAIQEHALRLFREQGYHATTVEQIAEAAEISPSTFFRYFPTKEDVVLQDDFDTLVLVALEAQPAGLPAIAAIRAAFSAVYAALTPAQLDRFRELTALTLAVPELRARTIDELSRTIEMIAAAVARRAGRDPGDFAVRTLAGAVVGVFMSTMLPVDPYPRPDALADRFQQTDAALALLESGLQI
jgi:AcrR family transcriptional regulator